jgi:hypothetical protein
MPYTIGFGGWGPGKKVSTAEKPTAKEALALVEDLQRSDEEIKFIRSPHDRCNRRCHAEGLSQRRGRKVNPG